MNLTQLFRSYELLVDKADQAFHEMQQKYGECIRCERHCSDCCHAVFGLFLIEAAYLKMNFDKVDRKKRRAALLRGNKADRDLKRLEKRLQPDNKNPQMSAHSLAKERIRCPLLDDNQECILYSHRPITCRVYGIPTAIGGKGHVCGQSGFKKGESYPAFDLDEVQRELYLLSKKLLAGNAEKASLLISMSKAISTSLEDLINENPGGPGKAG